MAFACPLNRSTITPRGVARVLLRGLLFRFGRSVTSDAEGMVLTGGELTLFEAVGRWA
jgi:hypothetical protein